jgi:hypothetical protein
VAEGQQALLIKLDPTDTGLPPTWGRPLPSTTTFWTNQSIRLIHPSDTSIDDATTRAGVPTHVEVTVKNIASASVSDVQVEAYVCSPSAGKAGPAQSIAKTTTMRDVNGVTSVDGRFTGFRPGALTAGDQQPIQCTLGGVDWLPSTAEEGHFCVIANTWLNDGSEGAQMASTDSLDPLGNQHHGWRNINVLAMLGGARQTREVMFAFEVANPDRKNPAELVLAMHEAASNRAIGGPERALLASGPYRNLKIVPSNQRTQHFVIQGPKIEPAPRTQLVLAPGETRKFSVMAQFGVGEVLGNLHTFDLVTTTPKGLVNGAIRLLALATR